MVNVYQCTNFEAQILINDRDMVWAKIEIQDGGCRHFAFGLSGGNYLHF